MIQNYQKYTEPRDLCLNTPRQATKCTARAIIAQNQISNASSNRSYFLRRCSSFPSFAAKSVELSPGTSRKASISLPALLILRIEPPPTAMPPSHARRKGLLELFGPDIVDIPHKKHKDAETGYSQEDQLPKSKYFEPADTAYLSPPWDSASYDECKGFLAEVRRSSLRLSNQYLDTINSGTGLEDLESALEQVFSSTIFGSNALEGVGLPEKETWKLCKAYLEGKIDSEDDAFNVASSSVPTRKRREVLNHVRAFLFLKEMIKGTKELNEDLLLQAHSVLLENDFSECLEHGKYRSTYCVVGSARLYDKEGEEITTAEPHTIPKLMVAWIQKYNKALSLGPDKQEVLCRAASLVKEFLMIHPFQDGNGRLIRILENTLVSTHYPFVLLPHDTQPKSRRNYMQSIRAAIKKDRPQFLAYRSLKSAWNSIKILTEKLH